MKLDKLVKTAVAALEDIKARDIVVLDVTKMTAMFDYMIIASADSTRQTKALANHVQQKVKAAGGGVYGMEGEQSGEWVLVDLGDVVVHVMQPVVREYYNLEELWAEAVKVKKAAAGTGVAGKKTVAKSSGARKAAAKPAPVGSTRKKTAAKSRKAPAKPVPASTTRKKTAAKSPSARKTAVKPTPAAKTTKTSRARRV